MSHRNNPTELDELMAVRQRIIETVNPSQVLLAQVDRQIAGLKERKQHETSPTRLREQKLQQPLFP